MKVFIVAACLFGLALAFPGGDKGGDRPEGGEGKGGPRGPIGGLVKLCISLAEAAEEEGVDERQFDFEEALVEICEFLLSEKPEETTAAPMDARSFWERARGGKGKGGDKQGAGGDRQGAGGDKQGAGGDRQGAGGDKKGAGEGQEGEKDIVDVLVRICGGLAKMAEEAEVEARAIETKEDLLEAMKAVCDAAEAEADARTTPATA